MPTEVVVCSDAEDLFRRLAPTSDHLGLRQVRPPTWIFRGVKDSEFSLVASALRPEGIFADASSPSWTRNEQRKRESDLLRRFYRHADKSGLAVPEDAAVRKWDALGDPFFPTKSELLPFVGLAQHHGVPTRLLDWTSRSYIGAFFAAYGVLTDESFDRAERKSFSVWAMNLTSMEKPHQYPIHRFDVVEVPYATNDRLRAQRGLFTVQHGGMTIADDRRPLDAPIPHNSKHTELFEKEKFLRFDLDWSYAKDLLRLLQEVDVSPATMFPGFAGAAEMVMFETRLEGLDRKNIGGHR